MQLRDITFSAAVGSYTFSDTTATRSQKSSTVKRVENCPPALSDLMTAAFYIFVDTSVSAFRGRRREWINARERQEVKMMKKLLLATESAQYENRAAKIENDLNLLKWRVGTNVAIALIVLTFALRGHGA
jgi:hypothetical protein